jgi:hypothetical protein
LGSVVLFAGTALHSVAAYPQISAGLSQSNVGRPLQAALRAVVLLVGWDWMVIGIVALLAAFTETKLRKLLVLFCGVALFVETALTLAFIGIFLGNELIGSSALLIFCGGLLFRSKKTEVPA